MPNLLMNARFHTVHPIIPIFWAFPAVLAAQQRIAAQEIARPEPRELIRNLGCGTHSIPGMNEAPGGGAAIRIRAHHSEKARPGSDVAPRMWTGARAQHSHSSGGR
jgi:hypothetical protein